MAMVDSLEEFARALPKPELHAHLTGSISRKCLHEIYEKKLARDPNLALDDPLDAIPQGDGAINIATFFPIFDTYIYALVNDEESLRYATTSVLREFAKDGVAYLELRTTPRAIPLAGISKENYIDIVLSTITDFLESNEDVLPTSLILSVDRKNTLEEALATVDLAIKNKHNGVVGVDLCGNPARVPINHLAPAFQKARDHGLPLTLHFAEIPPIVDPADPDGPSELEILLSWNPSRLGHVIHVAESSRKEIQKRGLGLELCLSCNVIAGMLSESSSDFTAHHFGYYWKQRLCPIAISTDDVGIFQSPLSNEYALAAQHFDLSKADLIYLARSASRCFFGTPQQRQTYLDRLQEFAINAI